MSAESPDTKELAAAARAQVSEDSLVDLIVTMADVPAPWGRELPAADAVAAWLARARPDLDVEVDVFAPERGNVVFATGGGAPELLVYSHLDTSLSGDPDLDEAITGRTDPVTPLRRDASSLVGPGLGVARVPAAAATIGVLAAVDAMSDAGVPHSVTLLLAAGGTHHRATARPGDGPASFGEGARHGLRTRTGARSLPSAVIVAKAGPPVVLHEEPGSVYVDLAVWGPMVPALIRGDTPPGPIGQLAAVLESVEHWRTSFVSSGGSGQIGREAAVGAIRAGDPHKCDLLPGVVRLAIYLVLAHGDRADDVVADLERHVAAELPGDGSVAVSARVGAWEPAGATPVEEPIVEAVMKASGCGVDISGWRGSTDGVVFRALGIPTARWGPTVGPDPVDPRLDRVDLAVAQFAAGTYAESVVRFASARLGG